MRTLLDVIDRLAEAAAVLAAVCLALLATVILVEVASVWLFNKSLEFSWEYGAFFMASAFFLGLGWTLKEDGHVRVGILAEHLPEAFGRYLDIAATVIGLAIAAFLTYALAGLAWSSFTDGSRSFTATATPLVIPQAVITAGSLILTLQLLARLARLVRPKTPTTTSSTGAQ